MDMQNKGEINLCSVTPLRSDGCLLEQHHLIYPDWALGARIRKQCSLVSLLSIIYVLLKRTGKRLYQHLLLRAHPLELLNEECPSGSKTILLEHVPFLHKILPPIFPARSWGLPPNTYFPFLKIGSFQRGKGISPCVSLCPVHPHYYVSIIPLRKTV